MSRYLALFVTEATEHLQDLSQDLVALEKERTPEAVDSLFRHAHSLKGMAASMGLEGIATLAHRVEDLMDALRGQAGALDQPLVDLLLEATDTMQAQVRAAGTEETPEAPTALLHRLTEAVKTRTGKTPAPTRIARNILLGARPVAVALPEAATLEVSVRVLPGAASPGARAVLVHRTLAAVSTVLAVKPSLDELRAGALPEGQLPLGPRSRRLGRSEEGPDSGAGSGTPLGGAAPGADGRRGAGRGPRGAQRPSPHRALGRLSRARRRVASGHLPLA